MMPASSRRPDGVTSQVPLQPRRSSPSYGPDGRQGQRGLGPFLAVIDLDNARLESV